MTQGTSLRALERDHGEKGQKAIIFALLVKTDEVCDGRNTDVELEAMAEMIIAANPNISLETLVMAVRDGLKQGKIFGKLTYPIIAQWILDIRERIFRHNEELHAARR